MTRVERNGDGRHGMRSRSTAGASATRPRAAAGRILRRWGRWIVPLLLVVGCGGQGPEIPEGAFTGDAVDPQVRESVEKAAETLFTRAREGEWDAIWESTASRVRRDTSREQFMNSIRQVGSVLGFPPLETISLAVVHFGESFPVQDKVEIPVEGRDEPLTLLLTDHPVQASLVQRSAEGTERFYYSTLWFREDGRWRLAAFFAKPATAYGRSWEDYEEEASSERLANHQRNAAILYNLAIDLVVPAAWVKPAEVARIEHIQRRINVTHLPAGRIMKWPAPPDTFKVFSAQYNIMPGGLGLIFGYESPVAPDDTLGQAEYAGRLYRFIEDEFPEYPEVFSSVTLRAYEPATHRTFWSRNYPLEAKP